MRKNTILGKLIYGARDLISRELFVALGKYCQGDVLDVGGGDFYQKVKNKLDFSSWTSLETSKKFDPKIKDSKFKFVVGDGCSMKFKSQTFDTVLCIQVLEHVFEPIKMMTEIARVLKPKGFAIFLIPHTSTIHMAPDYFQSFSNFWIEKVAQRMKLRIISLKSLGGLWSNVASSLFFFYLKSLGNKVFTTKKHRRNFFFYLFLPLMWPFAAVSLIVCLIFSAGDLTEEPNNYLVVMRK